ncbi:MAG: cytochrome-c peroxidase [Gammaproteobacteria bacterium]
MLKLPRNLLYVTVIITCVSLLAWWNNQYNNIPDWSADEIKILESLSINKLLPLPSDISNNVANNALAAEFGKQLFFDERLSHNAKISCATCHVPEKFFTDGLTTAAGAQAGVRNTPTIVGTAYSPWQFWDGRSDSQWSQALSPLENSIEHAGTRTQYAHLIYADKRYRTQYENLFGEMPNISNKKRFPVHAAPVENVKFNDAWTSMQSEDKKAITIIFVNLAKSIAAYERLLQPAASRFDQYIEQVKNNNSGDQYLNNHEISGLKLFIGKAQCIQCHNGPLLTNNEFHNTGVLSAPRQLPSLGRSNGARIVLADPFNCQGEFSNAQNGQCGNLRFIKIGDELIAAHKVPTLRNVADTAPYMHAGQLATLEEVINHYNQAPVAMVGHNEIKPLKLSGKEKKQLHLFLLSLSGPLTTDKKWLINPHI